MVGVSSIAPPPGLEEASTLKPVKAQARAVKETSLAAPLELDASTPAKIPLPSQAAATPPTSPMFASPTSLAALKVNSDTGVWASAVQTAALSLSSEGLRRALAIIDQAIWNAQHAKVLDELIGAADPWELGTSAYLHSAACQRSQISIEQMHLLGELHELCNYFSTEPKAAKKVATGPGEHGQAASGMGFMLPTQMQLMAELQQQFAPYYAEPEVAWAPPHTDFAEPTAAATAPRAPATAFAAKPAQARAQTRSAKAPRACAEVAKVPERVREKMPSQHVQTLSASLQLISKEDPRCVFIVRHINKLKFKALGTLKKHYSSYGTVVRVLGSHSTVCKSDGFENTTRRRPCSLGFVQMAEPEAVDAILAAGFEQEVSGVLIRVQKFEPRQAQKAQEEEQSDEQSQWMMFNRNTSSSSSRSGNSTTTFSTCISEDISGSKGSSLDALSEAEEEEDAAEEE